MEKIKIAAVSYLNTKPLLYGLFNHPVLEKIDLTLDIPSTCARKLIDGTCDIALMPVGALHDLSDYHLFSQYGICADGPVRTVCIYSEVPIEQVKKIYLDFHSRTSVLLAKYLIENFWKLDVEYLTGGEDFEKYIQGNTAGVVIGDKALDQELKSPYIYDLSAAWKEMHQLPFVFATWVSRKPLSDAFIKDFDAAQLQGINRTDQLVQLMANTRKHFDLTEYYNKYIQFEMDGKKKEALALYLNKTSPYVQLIPS